MGWGVPGIRRIQGDRDIMFTPENTDGYTAEQLAALNAELAERLAGVEPGSDLYYQIEHAFADEVGHR